MNEFLSSLRRDEFIKELEDNGEIAGFEAHLTLADGTEKDIAISARIYPEKGSVEGAVFDITDRILAEKALRRSELQYRLLAQNVSDVIWVSAIGTWERLYISPSIERLLGYSAEEMTALPAEDFLTPDSLLCVEKMASEQSLPVVPADAATWSRTAELELIRKDGSRVWTETRVSFLPGDENHVTSLLGVMRDISQRRKAEQRFLQSQKMEVIGRLAGGIAHDFNNILTTIIGNAELALKNLPVSEPAFANIEEVHAASVSASNLTRQLLAFGRKEMATAQPIDLNAIIEGMRNLLRRLIREDIEIYTVLSKNLPSVRVDRSQLEQVILNLAVNAKDAMPHGGKLTVETKYAKLDESHLQNRPYMEPGHYVMLDVADTGHGMDEETRQHVFEPFYTTKRKGMGTGLGLLTVYAIVEQSHGYINVFSEQGVGSRFTIYFPAFHEKPIEIESQMRPERRRMRLRARERLS